MAYPRELNLGEETLRRLSSYLDDEIIKHEAERAGFLNDIEGWQRDYWARPSTDPSNFPFHGASQIIIPINAINLEAVHARILTQLEALPEMVAVKFKSPEFSHMERRFEQYYDNDLRNRVNYVKKLEHGILDIEKLGTGVGYSDYQRVVRTAMREVNGKDEEFEVVVKEGADVGVVPLHRFIMPFNCVDPQTAPWCGEIHTRSPFEVKTLEQSGFFKPGTFEKLKNWVFSPPGAEPDSVWVDRSQQDLENRTPHWPHEFHWYEFWLAWEIIPGQKPRELVVHYHKDSGTFLSIRYNWNDDLRRKYRTGVYFPVEHRWTGVGIGKQVEQFMAEITAQHRQRIDNATLANTRMIKVHKMSGYGPDEEIYPGKMWFLDDMSHIDVMQMGEVYNSAYNNEAQTMIYLQQRTGINDISLGMQQSGTPGTATDTLSRVREGTKKHDYVYGNIKKWSDEIIVDYACNVNQFGARNLEFFPAEERQLAMQIFGLTPTQLRSGTIIELKSSGQKDNKLQDRTDWQQLFPQIVQYYTQYVQMAQMIGNQQLTMMIVQKAFEAGDEAMRQILQTFDVQNIDRIVLGFGKMMNAGQSQGGGIGGPPGIGQNQGLLPPGPAIQGTGAGPFG